MPQRFTSWGAADFILWPQMAMQSCGERCWGLSLALLVATVSWAVTSLFCDTRIPVPATSCAKRMGTAL